MGNRLSQSAQSNPSIGSIRATAWGRPTIGGLFNGFEHLIWTSNGAVPILKRSDRGWVYRSTRIAWSAGRGATYRTRGSKRKLRDRKGRSERPAGDGLYCERIKVRIVVRRELREGVRDWCPLRYECAKDKIGFSLNHSTKYICTLSVFRIFQHS